MSGLSESRTRDGMDPFTRAVSDALDGYLTRMGWNVSHTNPTWLAEELAEVGVQLRMTAGDRRTPTPDGHPTCPRCEQKARTV